MNTFVLLPSASAYLILHLSKSLYSHTKIKLIMMDIQPPYYFKKKLHTCFDITLLQKPNFDGNEKSPLFLSILQATADFKVCIIIYIQLSRLQACIKVIQFLLCYIIFYIMSQTNCYFSKSNLSGLKHDHVTIYFLDKLIG